MIRELESNMPEHKPRERSAHIWGLGIVRVRRCDCGQPPEPTHSEATDSGIIRAVCPDCHAVTLQIELEEIELEDDSDEA